jgi:hypothetical protein
MKFAGERIKNHKRRGEWAELVFMARAAELGFMPLRPWGESSAYDVVLEWKGQFMRVQVKSTTHREYNSYVCMTRSTTNHYFPYSPKDIDFMAVYVVPEDKWYVLPAKVAAKLAGNIWLSPHKKGHKYEAFLEAWELFREWGRKK